MSRVFARGTRTMGRRANGVYLTRGRTVTDVDGGPSHPMEEMFAMLPLGYVVTSYLRADRAVWLAQLCSTGCPRTVFLLHFDPA